MDQETLLEKLKSQDRSAVQYLYDTAYKPIKHYVRKQLGHTSEAEDIFQDALLILYDKIKAPEFRLTSTAGLYLLGISKYLIMRRKSKMHKIPIVSESDTVLKDKTDFEKEVIDREQYRLFSKHFDRLGEDCKKVLLLFFKKTSMKDIAEVMGYSSEAYAKKRKFKCQKKIITMIKADSLYIELTDNNE